MKSIIPITVLLIAKVMVGQEIRNEIIERYYGTYRDQIDSFTILFIINKIYKLTPHYDVLST
ncbi:MAG: hypothetical protein NMNS01_06810 [Nitrosomonas sp.]|nr:MAG: hypothetical protein NMNS01_06810 [Nitrosomonas sp.]